MVVSRSRRTLAAAISLVLIAGTAPAQEARDPASIRLNGSLRALLGSNFEAASEMFYRRFERYAVEDRIDLARVEPTGLLNRARKRADKVAIFLSIDLDWDGTVTRAELEAAFAGRDSGFVQGYLDDAQAGPDDRIDIDEMRAAALRDYPDDAGTADPMLDAMLGMDLDGDGFVTGDEVIAVLVANKP